MRTFGSALCLLALAGTACFGGTRGSSDVDASRTEQPAVRFIVPADGTTVEPGELTVRIVVEAFILADALGEEPEIGRGHVHFYLDVEIHTAPGEPAVTEEGTYAAVAGTTHTWEGIEPGKYTLGAQLVENDHTPLEPPVTATVQITVANADGS